MLFAFVDAPIWSEEHQALEIAYGYDGAHGKVRIPLRTIRELMGRPVTPDQADQLYQQNRTNFERAAERLHRAGAFEQPGIIVLRRNNLARSR